jgi:acyl-CoA thioesterase FadM
MTEPVWEFPLRLPRHAFSPRDAARAGDVWRCFQEAAVEASTRAGWPPQRYREARTAFVVRQMTVVHHREATYGEHTRARTWVWRFRRDTISTREVRLLGDDGPVASASQEWVHVSAELKPARAGVELTSCFPNHDEGPPVAFPEWEPEPGATHSFRVKCWYTWMDPLAHVNHPAYVDWCDEGISRVMVERGLSPVALQPVAEKMTFRVGVAPPDEVTIESRRVGRTAAGELVLAHRVLTDDGTLCVDGHTVRRLACGDSRALLGAFDAS